MNQFIRFPDFKLKAVDFHFTKVWLKSDVQYQQRVLCGKVYR